VSKKFHRVIELASFVLGIVCLVWGLYTSFALIRTPSLPDDAVYFDPPSLLETLGVDRIEVNWSRLAIAAAGGLVLWSLFRIIGKQSHENA